MKRFALTGTSIAHSRSPQLFEAAYHGKYAYELLPATTVEEALRLYEERGLSGMNVTTPFKETIVPYMDIVDEDVRMAGAANIVVCRDNRWAAHNSDVYGAAGALLAADVKLAGKECLVLGCGGAARAATIGLLKNGARVTVANRTVDKIKTLSAYNPVEALCLEDTLSQTAKYAVIVNALPALSGLAERIRIYPYQVVLEADYTCGVLRDVAHKAGAQYLSGLQWLLHQAIPTFRLFTGEEPDIAEMQLLLSRY